MQGTRYKQINNLVITLDNTDGVYRVYNPAGENVYQNSMLVCVEQWCKACATYLNKSKRAEVTRYIQFRYIDTQRGYSGKANMYTLMVAVETNKQVRPLYNEIMQQMETLKEDNPNWQFEVLVDNACKQLFNKEKIKWQIIKPEFSIDIM